MAVESVVQPRSVSLFLVRCEAHQWVLELVITVGTTVEDIGLGACHHKVTSIPLSLVSRESCSVLA